MSAWKRFAHGKAIPESDVEAERIRDPVSASLLTAAIAFRLGNLEVAKSTILKVPFPIVRDKMRARYAALVQGIRAVLRSKNGHPLVARDVVPIRVNETRRRERELAMAIRRFPVVPPWLITLRKMRVERAQPIITIAATVQAALPSKKIKAEPAAPRSIIHQAVAIVKSIPVGISTAITKLTSRKPKYISEPGLINLIKTILNYPITDEFLMTSVLSEDQAGGFEVPVSFENIHFDPTKILKKNRNDYDKYTYAWAPKNLRTTEIAAIKIHPRLRSTAVADYGFIYVDNDWSDITQSMIDYKCKKPIIEFLKEISVNDTMTAQHKADDVLQYIHNICKVKSIDVLKYTGGSLLPDAYAHINKELVAAYFKSKIEIVNQKLLNECELTIFTSDLFKLTITRGYGKKGVTVVETRHNILKQTIENILSKL